MKKILAIALAVQLAMLCAWRLWPHSLNRILDTDGEAFASVSVHVSEFGISGGSPVIDVYRLDISSAGDDSYAPFMAILQGTAFRQDFRNLLPWDILSVGSGQDNITHSANILFEWEDGGSCCLSFHGERIVSLDAGGETEYRIYHPTDRSALDQIAAYAKEHGALQT